MNQFQSVLSNLSENGSQNGQSKQNESAKSGQQESSAEGEEQEPATVKAAEGISETLLDRPLSQSEKETAGPAVHYTFGTSVGGAYGLLAELAPMVTMGAGLPFGTILWLMADEVAVPAFGLSEPPTEHPLSTHAYALASHLVYGLTTEGVRRMVRQVL